ncbi:MAG: hypothetical protein P1U63_02160 [Coxiellaceae bacterium]|nr:hypothetical protein [Coxiellaceae bacterium]
MRLLTTPMSHLINTAKIPCLSAKTKLTIGNILACLGALSVIGGTSIFLSEITGNHPKASHLWSSDGLSIGGASIIVIGALLQHLGLSQLTLHLTNRINSGSNTPSSSAPCFTSRQLRWTATINVFLSALSYTIPYYLQDKIFINKPDKTKGTTITPLTIASYPVTLLFLAAYLACFKLAYNSKVYETENKTSLTSQAPANPTTYQPLESGPQDIHFEADQKNYDSDTYSTQSASKENTLPIRTPSVDTTNSTCAATDEHHHNTYQTEDYNSSDSDGSLFNYS